MHGSRREDDEHSTPEPDLRSKAFPRVMLSLAIVGLMVGLMIGRLTTPDERVLEQVEVVQDGLDLWFNEEPKLHGENVEGTVAVLFEAQGKAQRGQLSLQGKPVGWRVQKSEEGLLLTVVAARPLHGEWAGAEDAGRWRVQVRLHE
ncbi:hypothetical protein PZ739_25950 [Pseudomonas kermanshahensis]|jgi:hypothetical protein|uniref:hypothetical protein n=1 Tax=Pseudomonas TaxID=286 RepID=UPI0003FB8EF5|nr:MULTISPECIES: hypothetical protein [Pseudomonas]ATP52500.1 hypothetical protein CR512_25450 [Pseudomonas putida]MCX2689363.1 hypothetical protein [Pseudomonas sp. DCB_AW]MDE4535728.1 hypothetical protein [Pseudomonas sp. ITEM 17296]UVL66592.1 hypothetical protein LOY53_24870 [Pseudomonas sp. B21-031]WEL55229.1 hypothetical protein PZ739_25950 [Pseudomonas kermanshahensis]